MSLSMLTKAYEWGVWGMKGVGYAWTGYRVWSVGREAYDAYQKWDTLTSDEKTDRIKLIFVGVADVASLCVGGAIAGKCGNVTRLARVKLFIDACGTGLEINRRINLKLAGKKDLDWRDYVGVVKDVALPRISQFTESLVGAKVPYFEKFEVAINSIGMVGEAYAFISALKRQKKIENDSEEMGRNIEDLTNNLQNMMRRSHALVQDGLNDYKKDEPEEAAIIESLLKNPQKLKEYLLKTTTLIEQYRDYLCCSNLDRFFNQITEVPAALRSEPKMLEYRCTCCGLPVRYPVVKKEKNGTPILATLYDGAHLRAWNRLHPGMQPPNWPNDQVYGEMSIDLGLKNAIIRNLKQLFEKKTKALLKRKMILVGLIMVERENALIKSTLAQMDSALNNESSAAASSSPSISQSFGSVMTSDSSNSVSAGAVSSSRQSQPSVLAPVMSASASGALSATNPSS